MKSFPLFILSACVLTAGLVGCSGESNHKDEGARCPENFRPISMTAPEGDQKISLDPAAGQIPPGDYQYTGASMYYVEDTGFEIYFNDTRLSETASIPTINCVRNVGKASSNAGVTAQGVIEMKTESASKILTTVKNWNFDFSTGQIVMNFKVADEKLDYPSKAYSDDPANPAFMLKKAGSDLDFEIRSQQTIPGKGTYWLSVRMTKLIPPAPQPQP